VVCPREPLLHLGEPWVERGCGTMLQELQFLMTELWVSVAVELYSGNLIELPTAMKLS
jgi:hypothetical protein